MIRRTGRSEADGSSFIREVRAVARKNMKKRFLLLTLPVLLSLMLVGCGRNSRDYTDYTKVIYELEGGTYQNCDRAVTQYYDFRNTGSGTVSAPDKLSGVAIKRVGFVLEGWYKTRTVAADGSVSYADKWDFSRDKVGTDGVTLYAHWEKETHYAFEICYRDDAGETHVLNSYSVKAGELFDDYLNYADTRDGYTFTGQFRDADGNPLAPDFRHPGGDADLTIRVFGDYIQGSYKIVRTAADLTAGKSGNLYLMNDIDFGGAQFGGFGDYKGTIEGNGYTVKNFRLVYEASDLVSDADLDEEGGLLCISLFRSLRGATLRNVSFTDFTVTIDTELAKTKRIFVAPLAMKISGATLTGVTVDATWNIKKLPKEFVADRQLTVEETLPCCYRADGDTSTFDNLTIIFKQAIAGS